MTHQNTKAGTLGGTCIAILSSLTQDDLIKTILLAAIGAAVSFMVSMLLRSLIRWMRKLREEDAKRKADKASE